METIVTVFRSRLRDEVDGYDETAVDMFLKGSAMLGFLGIKHYRDKALGGVIRFVPALLVGLGISAVACIIYAIAWEVSLAISGFDFGSFYAKQMIEGAQAKGVSAEELQKVTASAEAFAKSYANPLYRFPMTFIEMFPVGVLISLISAGLLRNPRVLPARARA